MNSWKAKAPPAWEPPFNTFWNGTGKTNLSCLEPEISAKCWYNGTFFSADSSQQWRKHEIILALSLVWYAELVQEAIIIFVMLRLAFTKAGAMSSLTLATALVTPLPNHLDLSPSLNSKASWIPVEAPDGNDRTIPCRWLNQLQQLGYHENRRHNEQIT